MPDNRSAVYLEGDTVIYRASALGRCLRALWAARSGMDRNELPRVVRQGMDEGTALEPVILNILYEKHGFTFGYQGQQFVVELNLGAWNSKTLIVRGAVDEIGHNEYSDRDLPIDVKALTEDKVQELFRSSDPKYDWQQSVYAHGTDSPAYYMPIFHKGTWEMVDWSLKPIEPLFTVAQIRDRVLQVEEAFYDGKMPDSCPGDFGCAYPYLHDDSVYQELDDECVLLARARIKLSQRLDTLTQARKALDLKLADELPKDIRYRIDGYTVSVIGNPRRFNTDLAKRILTDAEIEWENDPDFWIPGNGVQVRFTKPKGKGDG